MPQIEPNFWGISFRVFFVILNLVQFYIYYFISKNNLKMKKHSPLKIPNTFKTIQNILSY